MIDIVVYENGSTSLKSIVLGNQYENRDETINFTFPETFNDYYKYMIAVNKTVRPNKVVILPILENKLIISSSLTYDAGNWYMYTMIRQNEVDLSQPNPDMAAQEGEHVFISDGFVGIINRVNFTKEEIESSPLDQNLQIIYDELFKLKLQIEELIKDLSFDLSSLVKEEVDKLRPGIVKEVYNEVVDQVGQGVKGDKGAGFYSSSVSPNETFQIDLSLILPQGIAIGDHVVDPNGDVWLIEQVDTNVTVNSTKVSSLKGNDGAPGKDGVDGLPGKDGTNGLDGKSAYQIAIENGFVGTEKEWLDSLDYDHSEEFTSLASQVRSDAQSVSSTKTEIDGIKTNIDLTKNEIDTIKAQVTEKAQEVNLNAQHVSDQVSAFDKKVLDANTSIDTKTSESITSISQKASASIQQIDDKVAIISGDLDNKVAEAQSYSTEAKTARDEAVKSKTDAEAAKTGAEGIKSEVETLVNGFDEKVSNANTVIDGKVTEVQGYTSEAKLAKEEVITAKDEVSLKATQVDEAKAHIDNQVSSFEQTVINAGTSIEQKTSESISSIGTKTQEAIKTIETKTTEITGSIDDKVIEASGYASEAQTASTQVTQDKQAIETLITETNEKIDQDKISISESVSAAKTSETNAKASEEEAKKQAKAVKVDLTTKLDKNQGEVNKNKTLKINDSGEVVPGDEVYSKSEIDEDFGTVNDLVNELSYSGYKSSNGNEFHGETSDYGIEIESIKGNFYQEKTNGYQLFDASKLPTKSQGGITVTNNGDGSFTISGTSLTAGFNMQYIYSNELTKKILKTGILNFKVDVATNPRPRMVIWSSSNKALLVLNNSSTGVTSTGGIITEEIMEEVNNNGAYISIDFYASYPSQTIQTGTCKPMFYIDGDGTWERFTGGEPAPNPNYQCEPKFFEPREIYSVSKNMFNFDLIKTTVCENGTKTYDDNSITLKSTANNCYDAAYRSSNFRIKVKPNTKYTLLFKRNSTVSGITYIFEFDEDGNTLTPYQVKGGHSLNESITFTTKQNCNKVNFRVSINTSGQTCTFSDFMILEGELTWETVGGFIPYKGQDTTPLDIILRALPNGVCDTYENGVITRRIGVVTFDGSDDEKWYKQVINDQLDNFYIAIPAAKKALSLALSDKAMSISTSSSSQIDGSFYISGAGNLALFISKDKYATASEFKTFLQSNPITIWYELAEPTTEYTPLPTIPSYHPYTNAWNNSPIEATEIQYKAKTYDALLEQEQFVEEDYIKVAETDDIVSTSSNRGGAELLELDGAYEQQTTNGYQLFDQSKLKTNSYAGATVTNNRDGSFTISGSGNTTDIFNHYVNLTKEESLKLLKVGKLYLSGGFSIPRFDVLINTSSGFKELIMGETLKFIDITQEILDDTNFYIRFRFYASNGLAIKTGTIKPMLYQDGNGDFEQFTGGEPSPNPDYKQDMKAVEASEISSSQSLLEIMDCGKIENLSVGKYINSNGGYSDSTNYSAMNGFLTVNKSTKYLFRRTNKFSNANDCVAFYDENKNFISSFMNKLVSVDGDRDISVFTTPSNAKYLKLSFDHRDASGNILYEIIKDGSFDVSTTPFPLTLRALPNGVKDTYKNGILTRRVGEYKITSIDKVTADGVGRQYIVITLADKVTNAKYSNIQNVDNFLCNSATKIIGSPIVPVDNCIYQNVSNFVIAGTANDTLETFKEKFINTTIWYELATPQITTIDTPFIETYHPWTNIWTDSPIKTHMKIGFKNRFGEFYTKKEIDEMFKKLQTTMQIQTASMLPTTTQAEMLEEDYSSLVELIKEE